MKKTLLLSALLFAGPSAFAGFEGVLRMKITATQGNGTMNISLSPAGVRSEMEIRSSGAPIKMTSLFLFKSPDVVYLINDERKTYSPLEVEKSLSAQKNAQSYTVKKLGQETILGYLCQHVLVTGQKGGESEIWTSRDIMDYDSFLKASAGRGQSGDHGYIKALRDAGVDGFPVKSIHRAAKDREVTTELVKAEKKPLPKSLFEIPAGYKKSEAMAPGPALPPEAMKGMKDRMKNMTPEQREMIEKMMKQGSGDR